MVTYKETYDHFISDSSSKLQTILDTRSNLLLDLHNLYPLLESKKDDLAKCNVIVNHTKINITYFENLKNAVDSRRIADVDELWIMPIHIGRRFNYDNMDLTFLVRDYIKYFLEVVEQIIQLDLQIPIYEERVKIDIRLFREILSTINLEASKYILEYGYSFSLGKDIGALSIIKKKRQFAKPHREEEYFANKVNWGESLKELEHIAYTQCDDSRKLLADYKNQYINKYEFIKAMKVHSYDRIVNPGGRKWIIYYVDDATYWWHWSKSHCFIPNKTAYSFVPTNYVKATNGLRSQLEYTKTVTKVEDILNTDKLGMRDKLFAIIRFSNITTLNYKEYVVQQS